ncbi:iron uptake porin [filamentous cyanobacterium LEGE 11480]|uniref:Iron uptake porin n=1 Tax=Romeriopsis navalis LEGE 11480 TaxID=2777977 RepID=A0A928Z302_9CYAN|nr:iron uptake porin [Romeriopsis navalis]MBE9030961.1 iron uptake porin [Romeriopsis navalis LEGE 11480]
MKSWQKGLMAAPVMLGATLVASTASASEVLFSSSAAPGNAMSSVMPVSELAAAAKPSNAMSSVTSVSQLSDVRPTDWAFQALQSLVERYGCIAGYPDKTYRGNRAMTRYEFAAGLNACMDRVNELIAAATNDMASKQDLATLQKLQEDFAAELATLRGRVDAVEAKTATLEKQQFSTTTKLKGEVVFAISDTFSSNDNTETVFQDKIRLQLVTSFTGKDKLFTRLTAGSVGTSFNGQLGTQEGRFTYDGGPFNGNNVIIDRLHYVFPVGDKLKVTAMASLAGHWFYAYTFNPGLEVGGGGNGAISRFGERNAIYRFGALGQGIGFKYQPSEQLEFSAGYLARNGSNPAPQNGLTDGRYSALAQAVFKPSKKLKLGLTYANNYDPTGTFNFGGTGTNVANGGISAQGPVSSNAYGVAGQFDVSKGLSVRAWGTYTNANILNGGDSDIWTYALALAFPDLGKKGNMGAVIVGAEPYVGGVGDVPLHVEALYKYKLNKNITITPGLIWLTAPNQNNANDDVVIGTIRTTFSF